MRLAPCRHALHLNATGLSCWWDLIPTEKLHELPIVSQAQRQRLMLRLSTDYDIAPTGGGTVCVSTLDKVVQRQTPPSKHHSRGYGVTHDALRLDK
jgi:hypothetical protein